MNYIDNYTDFIFVENEPRRADIIFVAGNTFPQSSERAAELYCGGFAPYVMPSGRFSITEKNFKGVSDKTEIYSGSYRTEFEFMRDVLIKNGVPENAILKEDEATYTYQNALFSRANCDKLGLDVKTAIICCKNSHARRCLMYYQIAFPETEFIVCPVTVGGITRENWYRSDEGIELVLGETERLGTQFKDIIREQFCEEC